MIKLIFVLAALGTAAYFGLRALSRSESKAKRSALKYKVNGFFRGLEARGWIPRPPAFFHGWREQYPELLALEKHYPTIRKECEQLLEMKDQITNISVLGGNYTAESIHTAAWKSYMFKSGEFIEENCVRCPETTEVLRKIPGIYTAFFSILDPEQYVSPHWGYYRGFWRFHLGVIIPDDNAEGKCWIRINDDPAIRQPDDRERIEGGEVYHWKNGEGILFDDTYLHDAKNDSDEVRVVLWLDVRKKWPLVPHWLNMLFLKIAFADASVKRIRKNAVVRS
jgi:aspartyl/asparaginyl beta-hydroxylase (cupin superfamily)